MPHLAMIRDLRLDEVNSEELNRVVSFIMTRTPLSLANPSAAINTDAGRLFVAFRAAQVEDDEYIRVVLAAFYDAHAQRFTGRMNLPIDEEGFWKDSKLQWNDVWDSFDKRQKAKIVRPTEQDLGELSGDMFSRAGVAAE